MSSIFIENLAAEFEVPESDVESAWSRNVAILEKETRTKREKFTTDHYKLVEHRVAEELGDIEDIRVADFFESGMSAQSFLETLVSGDFNVQNVVGKRKPDVILSREEVLVEIEDEPEEEPAHEAVEQPEEEVSPAVIQEALRRLRLDSNPGEPVHAAPIPQSLQAPGAPMGLPPILSTDLGLGGGGYKSSGPVSSSVPSCLR